MPALSLRAVRPPEELARINGRPRLLERAIGPILRNDELPRGMIEKRVLLESADMVASDLVYDLYQEIVDDPISGVSLATVCADPWAFPNLLRDPLFQADVRADGRFVEFLEHYGIWSTS